MADKLTKEDVLRIVEDKQIKFVRFWFTDVLGSLKSFAVTPAELEGAFDEGMGFDGSSIEGFARIEESDMVAYPDPSTFAVLPWRAGAGGTARMFCDIKHPDGEPFDGDPRNVLQEGRGQGRGPGLHHVLSAPSSSSSTSRTAAAPRCSTTAATSTSPPSTPVATCAATPSTRCTPSASRWSTPTTRWPPRSTRSTCATRTR